ncbi:hypothetical protein AB0O01_05855 [Streptomyces sp. NPDC093252]|uniref:hypothetical protein n=1 Tax=Streptomyces sp. NPDC093252 TaxID=3154980 RepID=UPI0034435010
MARISSRFFSGAARSAAMRVSYSRWRRSSSTRWVSSAVMYCGAVHTVASARCG